MNIVQQPSPHHNSRNAFPILMIVNHTMDGTLSGTSSWFSNPNSQVSYHYGIGRNGEIQQYVATDRAAWHCAPVRSATTTLPHPASVNPNWYTIGIGWEGTSAETIPEQQYQTGLTLHRHLLSTIVDTRLPLRQRIVGHHQINSVGRPNCPGRNFPWGRLYADLASFERILGARLLIEGKQIPLEMISGRSFAPVRALCEALGYNVVWDEASQTVTAQKGVR